ncbi:MAG: hypothetical protein R2761_25895 [Acidimicrobiales bacterium]
MLLGVQRLTGRVPQRWRRIDRRPIAVALFISGPLRRRPLVVSGSRVAHTAHLPATPPEQTGRSTEGTKALLSFSADQTNLSPGTGGRDDRSIGRRNQDQACEIGRRLRALAGVTSCLPRQLRELSAELQACQGPADGQRRTDDVDGSIHSRPFRPVREAITALTLDRRITDAARHMTVMDR